MPLAIMTFNVLVGGQDRFDSILAIVATERPDVLVMQECVGWEDGARPRAVAEAIGVPYDARHAVIGAANPRPSGARYNVAMFSRLAFTRCEVHTRGVAHSVVDVTVGEGDRAVGVVGAHLVSQSEDERLAELAELSRVVPPADVARGAHVLAGDLNSLTRHDPYPDDLDARLARASIDKYGAPVRFDVMDRLLGAGWVDALRARPRSDRWTTARRGEPAVDLRTDYVLLSPRLASRLVFADVVDVGAASDHHAVIASLSI